jgi:hypothetical protein
MTIKYYIANVVENTAQKSRLHLDLCEYLNILKQVK